MIVNLFSNEGVGCWRGCESADKRLAQDNFSGPVQTSRTEKSRSGGRKDSAVQRSKRGEF